MNNLDIIPNLPNINNKLTELVEKSKSLQEERLAGLCNNVDKKTTEIQCNILNNILNEEFKNINLDFSKILFTKVENPIGLNS